MKTKSSQFHAAGFSAAEYDRRLCAVSVAAGDTGAAAVVITAQRHVRYLIGTACNSLSSPWPSPLILVYLVRKYDEDRVKAETRHAEVRCYFGDEVVDMWADILLELGLEGQCIGLELDRADLPPAKVSALAALLPHARWIDTSPVINMVMDLKSREEIAVMDAVAELNAIGWDAFRAALHPGATEREVGLAVANALLNAGSEVPHLEVVLGHNTAMPHAGYSLSASALEPGTPAFIEFSAQLHHYSSGLVRTALLGTNSAVERLYAVAKEGLDVLEATLRPGLSGAEVDHAVRSRVAAAGCSDAFRHRTGYACNIQWGLYGAAAGSIDLSPTSDKQIVAGMAFHTPINLFQTGSFGVGCSETWLVTDTGCRPFGAVARQLVRLEESARL
jgi:Xaa-Pro dipeptidase